MRYLNGVRMLQDLDNGKVHFAEKIFFLIFILLPVGEIIDNFFPSVSQVQVEHSGFAQNLILLCTIVVFSVINYKVDNRKVIERFIALFVVGIFTSYIFLIPISFVIEFLLHWILSKELIKICSDFLFNYYISLFILSSILFWRNKRTKKIDHAP